MSISLFPSGEPLRVTITAQWSGSRHGALLGFSGDHDDDHLFGIVVMEDGSVAELGLNEFTVDWRYKVETDRWVDINVPETDQET